VDKLSLLDNLSQNPKVDKLSLLDNLSQNPKVDKLSLLDNLSRNPKTDIKALSAHNSLINLATPKISDPENSG
jgi:hypothetical protein